MAALEAALALALLGWPVMPVRAGGKEPLTRNGVKDATTDEATITRWFRKWPDANVAVATGAPGPTVLDVDDLEAAKPLMPELEATDAPQVATPRGRHFYFAGQPNGTIALGFGELRGRGSYVVCPPSTHPTGKQYVWLVAPNGPLPPPPRELVGSKRSKGAGVREPVERVPHGQRHDHLTDLAVRLVRSGVTEAAAIERALVAEYEAVCVRSPVALPAYFTKIAAWAASSEIAKREDERKAALEAPELEPETEANGAGKPKRRAKRTLPYPPDRDAPLGDLRAFVRAAMGLPDVIRVEEVVRYGPRVYDPLVIKLSNGARAVFDAQGDVTAPRQWRNIVQGATAGVAKPGTLTGAELGDVHWALCVISTTTAEQRFEDDMQGVVDELVALAEHVLGELERPESRYLLLGELKARPVYDAGDRVSVRSPALIVDPETGKRYVRSSELMSLAAHRRLGISAAAFAGRMRMIGLERRRVQGHGSSGHLGQVLYELPPDPPARPPE